MALPYFQEAKVYYRAGINRLEDATFLQREGRGTAAVYLGGYAVECMFKALILSGIAQKEDRAKVTASFRGGQAHDFGWLRKIYFDNGGAPIPKEINKAFTVVNSWSTDMRYSTGMVRVSEAETFLASVEKIVIWVKNRC